MIEEIEFHIENSFSEIMSEFLIEDLYWIDEFSRALATMEHPNEEKLNNLICLFPPPTNLISEHR